MPLAAKLVSSRHSLVPRDLEPMNAPDRPIYLDYNGTTPVAPEVLDAMLPFLREHFGNASSTTPLGRAARAAIEEARSEVAGLIGARPKEVIFTGGGTEASNHAIRGFAAVAAADRRRIVTSTVEHPATEMPCRRLEGEGFAVRRIGVDEDGIIDLADARAAIDGGTALVTIIHAQNEIGTLEPVEELAEAARAAGAPIHVDASQSLGKVPVDVAAWGIDALTIAGHKLYAPKGIGALFLRSGHAIPSVLDGAGQEGGRRPGTENVPYIVGLGRACRIARERLSEDATRIAALKERLWQALDAAVPGLRRLGGRHTLPNTLSVLFPGIIGNDLLDAAPAIAASTGSACHAGSSQPSAIVLALGVAPGPALGAVRLSLGRTSDAAQIDAAATALIEGYGRLAKGKEGVPDRQRH